MIVPDVVIFPTLLAGSSPNQTLPSGPKVIQGGVLSVGSEYSVISPIGLTLFVTFEDAVFDPSLFLAVTFTTKVCSTSASTGV